MPKVIVSTDNAPRSADIARPSRPAGWFSSPGRDRSTQPRASWSVRRSRNRRRSVFATSRRSSRKPELAQPGRQRHVHPRQFGRLPWHERGVGAVVPLGSSCSSRGKTADRPRGLSAFDRGHCRSVVMLPAATSRDPAFFQQGDEARIRPDRVEHGRKPDRASSPLSSQTKACSFSPEADEDRSQLLGRHVSPPCQFQEFLKDPVGILRPAAGLSPDLSIRAISRE